MSNYLSVGIICVENLQKALIGWSASAPLDSDLSGG